MRHRGQKDTSQTEGSTPHGTLVTVADLMAASAAPAGKHRAPVAPVIPEQKLPTHDTALAPPAATPVAPEPTEAPEDAPEMVAETATESGSETRTETAQAAPERAPATVTSISRAAHAAAALEIPHTAQWRASHLPRLLAGSLLVVAVAGTAMLGVRYAQGRASDDFVSLAIGLGVVVVLWAVMIASTPQVVSLDGSMLTVRNTSGAETFDLSDGLQSVDVVGDPRTSYWAVLLHRPNATTVVLRRHDVDASELDPIVRHYRTAATQRFSERQARFSS